MDLKTLLETVVKNDGSDLHLCVGVPPVMRAGNKMEKIGHHILENSDIAAMLSEYILGKDLQLSTNEVDLAIEIENVGRFRANIYRDKKGLCAALRLVPRKIKSPQELGLPAVVERITKLKKGLILVTGITGSGKSTTLASLIDLLNTERSGHIITIEDPIEFVHEHKKCIVNQREVHTHTSSFLEALRAALRQDPNIILVGELRDLDTISMAVTAAETGQLVFATLHTRGATQAIDRIIDVFPHSHQEQIRVQLSDVLDMVISQDLIPAHEGHKRYLACEVLISTQAVKNLIREKKTFLLKSEIEMGSQLGMLTMEKSLKALIDDDKITFEEALPWVNDKRSFECYFKKDEE